VLEDFFEALRFSDPLLRESVLRARVFDNFCPFPERFNEPVAILEAKLFVDWLFVERPFTETSERGVRDIDNHQKE